MSADFGAALELLFGRIDKKTCKKDQRKGYCSLMVIGKYILALYKRFVCYNVETN